MALAAELAFPQQQTPYVTGDRVRVLLAVDDVAARLTLEAVLSKSGYAVDSAASSAEAMDLLETEPYALVLCNLGGESTEASREVIRLARRQEERPATAYLTTSQDHRPHPPDSTDLLIAPVDIPWLLTQVTDLLANRAFGRATRRLRSA